MPVSTETFDKIHVAFLALERKFTRHTIAGTVPDVEREFNALKEHIETAKLEDAEVQIIALDSEPVAAIDGVEIFAGNHGFNEANDDGA